MSSTDNFYKYEDFVSFRGNIRYSDPYFDDRGIKYRHVIIPREQLFELLKRYTDQKQAFVIAKIVEKLIKGEFLTEQEWKRLGLQMSKGWEHYTFLRDPFVMGFRCS